MKKTPQDETTLSDVLRTAESNGEISSYIPAQHRRHDATAKAEEAIKAVGDLAIRAAQENHGTPTAALIASSEVSAFIGKAAEYMRKSADHVLEEVQHFHDESHKLAKEFEAIAEAHARRTVSVTNSVKEMTLNFQDLRNKFLADISNGGSAGS